MGSRKKVQCQMETQFTIKEQEGETQKQAEMATKGFEVVSETRTQ